MVNLWGPGAFFCARPAASRPSLTPENGALDPDDWLKDCSSVEARDGTELRAGLLNALLAQLRGVVRSGSSVSPTNLDDLLLAKAMASGHATYAVATGTANAWTVSPALAVPAYAAGRVLNIIAPATNTSTTVNANISTLGNRRIKKRDGSDPAIGDLVSGTVYATIDDGTNIRVLTSLPSDTVATVAATVPVSFNATWSQSLSDSTQTDITGYTNLNSNLGDATFSGGVLTVGPNTAGLWLAVFSGAHPSSNTEMLGQLIDAATGGNSFAYNSSRTTTGAPFVTVTGVIRRANGEKIRGQARQISGGTATCTGRISLIRLGA
jgi:hypothetical protein